MLFNNKETMVISKLTGILLIVELFDSKVTYRVCMNYIFQNYWY